MMSPNYMFKRLAIIRTHEVFVNRLTRTRGHQDLVWTHTALPKMGHDNMILISYPDNPTANGHASVVCQSDSSRKTNSLVAAIRRYSFSNAYQWVCKFDTVVILFHYFWVYFTYLNASHYDILFSFTLFSSLNKCFIFCLVLLYSHCI